MRGSNGRRCIDVDDLIVDLAVEHVGYEIRSDALDLVRPRLAGRQKRRLRRLDGHDLELRFDLLEHLSNARDRTSGSDATHQNVDLAVGVLPELNGGGPPV